MFKQPTTRIGKAIREMTVGIKQTLTAEFETTLSQMPPAEQKEFKRRAGELHPSGFPYCGLRHAYETLVADRTDPAVYRSFGKDYILGNGTLMHAVLQQWLGAQLKIVGNWRCMACKNVHRAKTKPKKGQCVKCGSVDLNYEEIGGKSGRNIYWHSDGLWKDTNGRWWVIDYKSTSSSRITKHRQEGGVFPNRKNVIQIESYVLLLEEKLGIKIHGWLLIYLARDFPQFMYEVVGDEMTEERRELVASHMKVSDSIFQSALAARDTTAFAKLRKRKLCSSRTYYNEVVADEYSPCPLHKVCFKSDKLDSEITKQIKLYNKRPA